MNLFMLIGILVLMGLVVARFTKTFPNMPTLIKFMIEVGYVGGAAYLLLKISHVI